MNDILHSDSGISNYMATKSCRNGTFLFNRNDTFVGRSMELYGEWCEEEIELLAQVVKAGDVVLDVGANIATRTVPLARMVTDSGFIVAFEPQRLVFQNLCANLALNSLRNVIAKEVGVGSSNGWIPVPAIDPRQMLNFAALPLGNSATELVRLVRIDDLKLDRCNLIKVDVEGMEVDVLNGAVATIARFRPSTVRRKQHHRAFSSAAGTAADSGLRRLLAHSRLFQSAQLFRQPDERV
ncbi:MAG: FkbM family methyltransferase [Planctomycetaceae bacterium]